MKLSEKAAAHILDREEEERTNAFRKSANDRKRSLYWIGFLEGTLSSTRVEAGEQEALLEEASKFREFFEDPDADDLIEDMRARCFSSEEDLMEQIAAIVGSKREEVLAEAAYSETDEMNEFLGFCAGIICDGKILALEVEAILDRFRRSDALMGAVPFAQLRRTVEAAMADRILTDAEAEEIREWLAQLVGDGFIDTGIANIGSVSRLDDPITDHRDLHLDGAHFVLTGPMKMGPRSFIVSEIERVGGVFEPRTTRRTDFVVVSSTASRHWRTTHFGTKIERAKELIEEGHKLRFVSEDALARAIAVIDEIRDA